MLAAIKDLTLEEIEAEHDKTRQYGARLSTLQATSWENIEYAISIAPKVLKLNRVNALNKTEFKLLLYQTRVKCPTRTNGAHKLKFKKVRL